MATDKIIDLRYILSTTTIIMHRHQLHPIGTLRSEDSDGRKNVAEKVNSRFFFSVFVAITPSH